MDQKQRWENAADAAAKATVASQTPQPTHQPNSFDIALFQGDPNRGPDHAGWMYSLRTMGLYVKSAGAYSTPEGAAVAAAQHAKRLVRTTKQVKEPQ